MIRIDWENDEQRLTWEKELDAWRKRREQWTWWQTIVWVWQIFILPFIQIFFLYGKFNWVKLIFMAPIYRTSVVLPSVRLVQKSQTHLLSLGSSGDFWLIIFDCPLLAGICAVWIVNDARKEKAEKELEMRHAWMQANNVTEVILNTSYFRVAEDFVDETNLYYSQTSMNVFNQYKILRIQL